MIKPAEEGSEARIEARAGLFRAARVAFGRGSSYYEWIDQMCLGSREQQQWIDSVDQRDLDTICALVWTSRHLGE